MPLCGRPAFDINWCYNQIPTEQKISTKHTSVNVQLASWHGAPKYCPTCSEEWADALCGHIPKVHMPFYWFSVGQRKSILSTYFYMKYA